MSKPAFAGLAIPRDLRFAFGYVEFKPMPKQRVAQGNQLWQSPPKRQQLFDETRARLESDLNSARLAGDWGKVNRLAALLSQLIMKG